MKLFRNLLFTLVVPFSLSPFAANAQYENMSPQGLLDELATTLNLTRETEAAINANLVIKKEYTGKNCHWTEKKQIMIEMLKPTIRFFDASMLKWSAMILNVTGN